jgi:hypothetical protein
MDIIVLIVGIHIIALALIAGAADLLGIRP